MIKYLEKFTRFNTYVIVAFALIAALVGLGWAIVDAFNENDWLWIFIFGYLGVNFVACLFEAAHYIRRDI